MSSARAMLHRRSVVPVLAVVIMGLFAACSSDSTSSTSAQASVSPSGSTLEQAKESVCSKLTDALTAVVSFQANQDGEITSTISSLATDLSSAASLLNTVGATDVADDVKSLSADLKKLAKSAPGDVEDLASDAQTKITTVQSTLACPSASASVSMTASASPTM